MKEVAAVNGVIRAEVLYYSSSRKGMFLRVWNDEKPHCQGRGWLGCNPHKLPTVGEVLAIPCKRATFTDSISRSTIGGVRVVWEQVAIRWD